MFLVYVDRLSGWPVVAACGTNTTAASTIRFCRMFFRDLGVPVRLRTDGGPQFTSSEFEDFLRRWGVRHDISTPHYPQSNGHAEAAVKSVKYLVKKVAPSGTFNEEFDRSLLELRNTPRPDGRSPAQVLFGHSLRSCVPAHRSSFASHWLEKTEESEQRAATRSQAVKRAYDSRARPLASLPVGEKVRVQDPISKRWDKVGVVTEAGPSRAYMVKTQAGRVLRRNRRFLRVVPAPCSHSNEGTPPCDDVTAPFVPRRSPRGHRHVNASNLTSGLKGGKGGVGS